MDQGGGVCQLGFRDGPSTIVECLRFRHYISCGML